MKTNSNSGIAVRHGPIPYDSDALRRDVLRVQSAWKKYRRSHRRTAIYRLLSTLFETMAVWEADGRAESRALRAMADVRCKAPRSLEPFSALIALAAHPTVVDNRTLAKWSRVLRYAAEFKLPSTPLAKFIKSKGGINETAALFTRRLGR